MFDLTRLRVLRAVADQGTLAAAADVLHLTPSAVSQQVSKLEREAKCTLIERHGRGSRLTEEGLLLAKHAETILAAVEAAEADLDERRGQVVGRLAVGAFATAARGLLPEVLVDLTERHPGLRITMREIEPYQAIAAVSRGDLDVVVTQDWANVPITVPERLSTMEIGTDPADVALRDDHRLAGRGWLSFDELIEERWIISTPGTICLDWLTSTFRAKGHEPDIAHYAAEFPTQLALVSAGLGIALIPRLAGDSVPADVLLVPVRPTMSRRIFAVWREESGRRPALRAFAEELRRQWKRRARGSTRSRVG
ncbi:DNA-binding transcriptional LysR family regulator [Herbihabitans rhizosphaerae]|uniref:DNA-binding transcriptional LysR family regulator n=1 Tax=Herbihabitans rhizosphaerae TaxID=1872711 RepID=A0A4Q7KRM1_9PSEU|nr:LysR family transcriptional regulator [Herbihabitans rhizosphaerae]RZS39056.1 DNA-binding transcriptional LysR family regulator [Herbihabitans rhizosphaerae]